jgi:hypothetical protein
MMFVQGSFISLNDGFMNVFFEENSGCCLMLSVGDGFEKDSTNTTFLMKRFANKFV